MVMQSVGAIRHIIPCIAVTVLFTACSLVYDEPVEHYPDVPVSVSVTRANDVQTTDIGRKYNLLLWEGANDAIPTSLFYHFENKQDVGGPFYPTQNGADAMYYPEDNSSIWGVGYLPADSLITTDNYNTLTINNTLLPAGFFDVCSTDVIEGKASSPFDNDAKRFDFKHTLVKLDFTAVKTVNVNALISDIYITLKKSGIRDRWVYDPTIGYRPGLSSDAAYNDIVFTSGKYNGVNDFDIEYENTGGIQEWATGKELFYEYVKGEDVMGLKSCYISHDASDTFIFKDEEGTDQAYIRLYDLKASRTKVGVPHAQDIENLPDVIDIPLTDMDGNPWREEVKAGDAFKIYILFDQNKIRLFAQKEDWNLGGRLYIPLNPEVGEEITY